MAPSRDAARAQIQPRREIPASKCKQMKAKLLSFVFNNFSESGLFNGLRAKNKKFRSLPARVPGCDPNTSNSVHLHPDARLSPSPVNESSINIVALFSGSGKKMPETLPVFLKSSVPRWTALSPAPGTRRAISSTECRFLSNWGMQAARPARGRPG